MSIGEKGPQPSPMEWEGRARKLLEEGKKVVQSATIVGQNVELSKNDKKLAVQIQELIEQVNQELQHPDKKNSKKITNILSKCEKKVKKLSHTVEKVVKKNPSLEKVVQEQISGIKTVPQTYGLLKTQEEEVDVGKSLLQWHINLGLLMNVYKETKDPQLKKQIEGLALQYLAKAAAYEVDLPQEYKDDLKELHQLGFFQEVATYHREFATFEPYIFNKIRKEFVPDAGMTFALLDTKDIEELEPITYSVVKNPKQDTDRVKEWAQNLEFALKGYISKEGKLDFSLFMAPPLLFDFTPYLEELIKLSNDPAKNELFKQKLQELQSVLDQAVISASETLHHQFPHHTKEEIAAFIRGNLSCICRSETKGIAVLHILPIFDDMSYYAAIENKEQSIASNLSAIYNGRIHALTNFLHKTGTRLGGVRGRTTIFNVISFEELLEISKTITFTPFHSVEYSSKGENVQFYKTKSDAINTQMFKRFEARFTSYDELYKTKPQQAVLGRSMINLTKGLLSEITEEEWKRLNENPETRQLLQTALFRLMTHLADAENNINNFTRFSASIELAHAELTTLLAITSPFKNSNFETIYKSNLTTVPDELKGLVKVGIGKSAMNVFSGINAKVLQSTNGRLERVIGEGSYFEVMELVGENRIPKEILHNDSIPEIDLYVGEFNHNINVDMNHKSYKAGSIKSDIEGLLTNKPDIEHLTIAIDATIDTVNSEKLKDLLTHFSKEIQSGKLNFVIFRSGQKFDMLGQDNFYGAPFYVINNGDPHWESFNKMNTEPAFQTDSLSRQWFCLANKYAFNEMEDYRKTVFKNNREVLDRSPEILKPGNNPDLQISLVDSGMDASFIDIKVLSNKFDGEKIAKGLKKAFLKRGKKFYNRASFGFIHANLNVIKSADGVPRNLRINMGLDPEENQIVIEFLQELAKSL